MLAHRPLVRTLLTRLLAPAVALAVGACGNEEPLAPSSTEPLSPEPASTIESTVPATGDLAALTTPRVAFMSYRYNDWPNLFTMTPSGTDVHRLTSWAGYVSAPAWSFDNKQIAMSRERVLVNSERHFDIFVMNADGSNKHWARPTADGYSLTYPSWSPDGTHLLVTVDLGGTPYLVRLKLATGGLEFVSFAAGGPAGTQASYDPTGKKIIYVGPNDGATIERINADGTGHATIYSNPSAHFSSPRYSPDGKRILFTKSVNNNPDVYVRNADGSLQRLTTWSSSEGEAAWSPDGSKIIFTSSHLGVSQVWTMPSTGGAATRITNTSSIDAGPVYTH